MADQGAIRAHNLQAVVQYVRGRGQTSRRDIGQTLGLNKATVSSLVGDLIGRGLLQDGDQAAGQGPGRPSTLVKIDSSAHASVVVELLADSVQISAWALSLEHLSTKTVKVAPAALGPATTMLRVRQAVGRTVESLRRQGRRVVGVTIAAPGLIDVRAGVLVASAPLGWSEVPLVDRLQTGEFPVLAGRIANLATIAEWQAVSGCENLICLHGGDTGLGAGAVVGGRLLTGSRGRAGELVFPTVDGPAQTHQPEGANLGLVDLLRRAHIRADRGVDTLVTQLEAGEQRAATAVTELAVQLAARLSTLTAFLDPQTVVLAGYLAELGQHLRQPLEDSIQRFLTPRTAGDVEFRTGKYGPEAAQVGGATLLADRAFNLTGATT
jgi:predicted NBD/HSP70 family sugar kinase